MLCQVDSYCEIGSQVSIGMSELSPHHGKLILNNLKNARAIKLRSMGRISPSIAAVGS